MGSKLLKDVEEAGKKVLEEISRLEECGILPLKEKIGNSEETIDAESLKKTLNDIMKSNLTIAVCGFVKAGKSTFLNSILFGKNVLPTFPTPCTAKLTFITHTDGKQGFTATFFTKEEFSRMKNGLAPDYKDRLNEECNRLEQDSDSNVSPYQLYGKKIEEEVDSPDELKEKLRKYASEQGRFTPFVKEIELRINSPELKGLFIVDTPGLDDPNPLNSLETERWARQAHAVIYLLKWRGMGAKDKVFIESNFGKVAEKSSNRIFVISRIDENKDWLDTVTEFQEKFPFAKDNICGYSAYADILRTAEANGETIPIGVRKVLDGWRREGFNHDPYNVRSIIADRLFKGKGEDGVSFKIHQLANQIKHCYEQFIAQRDDEILSLEEDIMGLGLEKEEALKKVKDLCLLEEELRGMFEDAHRKAMNSFENGEGNGFARVKETETAIRTKISRKLNAVLASCQRDAQILDTLRSAKIEIEKIWLGEAVDFFKRKMQDADDALSGAQKDISYAIFKAKCENCIRVPDKTPFVEKSQSLLSEIELAVNFGKLDECIHWYNSVTTNLTAVRAAFEDSVRDAVQAFGVKILEYQRFVREVISGYVSKTIQDVEDKISLLHEAAKATPKEKQRLLEDKKKELKKAEDRRSVGAQAYQSFNL